MIFFILFNLIYFFGLLGGRIISINTVHHSFKKKNTSRLLSRKKTVRLFVLYLFTFYALFIYFFCMLSFCAIIVVTPQIIP